MARLDVRALGVIGMDTGNQFIIYIYIHNHSRGTELKREAVFKLSQYRHRISRHLSIFKKIDFSDSLTIMITTSTGAGACAAHVTQRRNFVDDVKYFSIAYHHRDYCANYYHHSSPLLPPPTTSPRNRPLALTSELECKRHC